MKYDPLKAHRRVQADYRLALGLDLKARREAAGYSFSELAMQSYIPVETLRTYEKGQFLPQSCGSSQSAQPTVYLPWIF